jgi:general secretion pathway protein G
MRHPHAFKLVLRFADSEEMRIVWKGCLSVKGGDLSIPREDQASNPPGSVRGFTLLELMVTIGIVALIAAIGFPSYISYKQRAYVAAAATDIMTIATAINRYNTVNNSPPPDLATIGFDTLLDPWGRPYVYLSFAGLSGKGKMRKDKNLNPLNTQYDLYSVGADGQSKPPLTVPESKDDVILANDGNYIGLASNY